MPTVRTGVDAHVRSDKPSTNYKSAAKLRLASATAEAFVWFDLSDVPRGATITQADLQYRQSGGPWAGSRTLTAQRAAASWKARLLTWSNRPGVAGTPVPQTQADTVDGTVWSWSVVADVQAFVDGEPNNGWRLTSSDATARFLHSFDASSKKPTLVLAWTLPPVAPDELTPDAAAVSVTRPVLQWDAGDFGAFQVQVFSDSGLTTVVHDSGTVVSSVPSHDLAATAYAGSTAQRWWRVRVRGEDGTWSPYSAAATWTHSAHPTVTINSPGTTVYETTPPISWTSAGQVAYQVLVAKAAAPGVYIYDSGRVTSTATTITLPSGVITKDGASYVVTVRTWDAVTRVATAGAPAYAAASVATLFSYDPTPDPVTRLSVEHDGVRPWVQLTWERSAMPDEWLIIRDGVVIATLVNSDPFITGTTYGWKDWTVAPNRQHVYRVAPVVNGKAASGGPTFTITPMMESIWVTDPARGLYVGIAGDSWQMEHADRVTLYEPVGGSAPVQVTTALMGLAGAVNGVIEDYDDRTWQDYEADLLKIKEAPASTYRLVMADINIPAVLRNVTCAPDPSMLNGRVVKAVSFSFFQNGELPFDAEL